MSLINCKECGQQISDAASVCPHCGAPVVTDIYCSHCGTRIPENTRYCPNCGEGVAPCDVTGKKDKVVAGLLAIFLGGLGIHYFYLGKTTAGVLTIVISLFSCYIWTLVMFIQGILMLTMSDEDFNAKYVENDRTFPLF